MEKVLLTIREHKKGSSLVEVILAVATFSLIAAALIGAIIYGQQSTAVAGARERASKIAEEGIEAVRNIRDSGYSNLPVDGTYGLVISGGVWTLTGSSDTTDIFLRTVTISTIDSKTRKLTVNVTWDQTEQRTNATLSLNTYLTDWTTTTPPTRRHGMFVYGDGGTTSDAIKYQIYDDTTGTWTAAANTADVDGGSTNKYLRAARVYASSTRDEKVLVSRHYNGTTQWIYSQVYNGSTGTWGNVNQLATWSATTYLDVQNFDGAYLANGDFVVIYSDNTTTPKFKKWNGSAWSTASGVAGTATPATGGIPNYISLKQRPGTNEAMAVFFDQSSDTNSLYFWIGANGTYETADWVLATEHSATAPMATKKFVDFNWSSSDPTQGAMVYTDATTDKAMNIKIWTANGSGSGSWGATAQYGTAQASNIGALSITPVKGTENFVACDKDALATPRIICMRANTSGWIAASNTTVSAATDAGIQQSFDLGFEQTNPAYGIFPYSDNTTTAKLKKFTVGTNTWDGSATNMNSSAVGVIKTTRAEPNPITDDVMLFVTDANMDVYSVLWDGTGNQLFTAPVGKAWLTHGTAGSATTDFWYDFAWDGM